MSQISRFLPLWALPSNSLKLEEPMVWLSGPRQVGKTFLAKNYSPRYFNWDTPEVKKSFIQDPYFFRDLNLSNPLVIFDEIHKKKNWKSLLKGYYDSPNRAENFFITGSGRFNMYRKGGDSLQGRYFSYQLWPLLFGELFSSQKKSHDNLLPPRDWKTWSPDPTSPLEDSFLKMGGFPAPWLNGTTKFLNKWKDQYLERLVYEDVRDFAAILHLDKLETLTRLLPGRLTSPLSENSLAEDLEVSPITVKSWLNLLETLYLGFSVPPYHRKINRSVKKERKWYFYQWAFAQDKGSLFENFMAVQLAAVCSSWTEQGYGKWELYYLRDQDRREIDFLISKDLIPQCLIEAKSAPEPWPAGLKYYCEKLKIPGFLVYPDGPTKKYPFGFSLGASALLKNLL